MKRILFGMGSVVLGLAALTWSTAPASGGRGHGGGHGGGGGHAAPAHVGSVHYASRPAPARVEPAARSGTVRSEHYEGAGNRGGSDYRGESGFRNGYRNRYNDEYFNRFRPGYLPYILSDGYQYYGYNDLPLGYQTVVEDGVTYYLFDGVYYRAYIIGGQTVYIIVPN